MASPSTTPHPALQQLRHQLQSIHDAISNFHPSTSKPPILDSSLDIGADSSEDAQWLQQEHIPGLKKLRDSVKVDLDVLEKVGVSFYSKGNLSVVNFRISVVSRRPRISPSTTTVHQCSIPDRSME
jgi:hypothetical protein